MIQSQPININRDDLARFIKDPRTIRAFENINLNQDTIVETVGDIQASPVIGITVSDAFENDRALAGSSDILLTDGGPKGNLGIELTATGVSASNYGDASHFVQIAVDPKGRITLAAQYSANTNNITEGGTNLYFTTSRARASIAAGNGINYSTVTGVIAVTPAGTYGAPAGTLSRASLTSYTAPAISSPPTQAEVQAIANALQATSRTLAALITDLQANGNLS